MARWLHSLAAAARDLPSRVGNEVAAMDRRWLLAAALACGVAGEGSRANACGGCFAPPGAVQVVTDHRMVFALSPTQTTLWDQFSFAGDPSEFSWILPLHYDPNVQVQIADDRFMTIMDNVSAPVMVSPPPPQSQYCGQYPGGWADAAASDASSADSGVTVYREQAVGPYAVAIVGGSDPMAIRDWMIANGYTVPDAVSPVIDYYTTQHMDFLALKLRPAVGLNRMAPVRITMPGYLPVLPLRMIAAGVGDKVNLVLMVLSSGRVEATNFPNGEISEDSLVYDYNHPTSPSGDYLIAFNRLNAASGERLWLAESSMDQAKTNLDSFATQALYGQPRDAGCDDAGSDGDAGGPSTCTATSPLDDVAVAFTGLGSAARVTRLRASLGPSALDRDLVLQASDLGLRDRYYHYGTLLNVPPPPPPCDAGSHEAGFVDARPSPSVDAGFADARRTDGGAGGDGGVVEGVGGGCHTGPRARDGLASFAAVALALGAIGFGRRRARVRD